MVPENTSCAICIGPYKSPMIAKCGHSFCESCITEALNTLKQCPICGTNVDLADLFPNLGLQSIQKELERNIKLNEEELKRKKMRITESENIAVVKEFLNLMETKKMLQFGKLQQDLDRIQLIRTQLGISKDETTGKKRKLSDEISELDRERISKLHSQIDYLSESFSEFQDWDTMRQKIQSHTKLYSCKEISCFRNSDGLSSGSQIVSSIESNHSGGCFATAGVLKQINLFSLTRMLDSDRPVYSHNYPSLEIKCNSKISCLSWNSFYETRLCSADYDGILNMYDASSGKICNSWTEHEKRCWSVDTSVLDPQRLISGSDDCKVKLWSQTNSRSLLTIDIKVNVCSVRFSPIDTNIVAVGAADHRVFLFDIRKPSSPILNQKEYLKSVSYVRFTNSGSSLLSASTDSTLRLWNQNKTHWKSDLIMSGHVNEMNFVGLSIINDNLIATGSEDNTVVLYNQNIPSPVLKYQMRTTCPLTGSIMEDEHGTFVSSVSWANRTDKDGNYILLSANSIGNISVLSIVEE